MKEMFVDWDHIEGLYKEDSPASSVNIPDSISPTVTMLSSRQVPFSPTDNNATTTSIQSPVVVLDVCITKPDAVDEHRK